MSHNTCAFSICVVLLLICARDVYGACFANVWNTPENTTPRVNVTMDTNNNEYLKAVGGTAPYAFTLVSGSPPPGTSFVTTNDAGIGKYMLTGMPTQDGFFNMRIKVTDAASCNLLIDTQWVICSNVISSPSRFPNAYLGTPYSFTITTSGFTADPSEFSWSGTSPQVGGTLQNALPVRSSATSGLYSGTPGTDPALIGDYSATLSYADVYLCRAPPFNLQIRLCPNDIGLASTDLGTGNINTAFAPFTLTPNGGGTGPYTFSVPSSGAGALPTGLTLGANSGVISGKPTVSGAFDIAVTVTDSNTCAKTITVTMKICDASIIIKQGRNYVVGLNSQYTFSSTSVDAHTWSFPSGSPIAGMSLNSATGVFSGSPSPSTEGIYTFTVQATDTVTLCTKTADFSGSSQWVVCPFSTFSFTGNSAAVGVAYSSSATCDLPGATFSISAGALPDGLTISSAGLISGTPTASAAATSFFTIAVTGVNGCTKSLSTQIDTAGGVTTPPPTTVTSAPTTTAPPSTTTVAPTSTSPATTSSKTTTPSSTSTATPSSSTTTADQTATTPASTRLVPGLVVNFPYCPTDTDIAYYRARGANVTNVPLSSFIVVNLPSCSGGSPPFVVFFVVKDDAGNYSGVLNIQVVQAINTGAIPPPAGRAAPTATAQSVGVPTSQTSAAPPSLQLCIAVFATVLLVILL